MSRDRPAQSTPRFSRTIERLSHENGAQRPRKTAAGADTALDEDTYSLITNFIEANISKKLSVHKLARLARLSRYHFSRRFKARSGLAPYAYITTRRIEIARPLVLNSSMSFEMIAETVGFSDLERFRTAFKKRFGANPSAMRKHNSAVP